MNRDMYLLAIIMILVIGIFFINSIDLPSTNNQVPIHTGERALVKQNTQAQTKVSIINSNTVATVTVE